MIKLRIDVDYPYRSRLRSFVYTTFGVRFGRNYLSNSKIIAEMINESSKGVKAYWFFTPKTLPDTELLRLLRSEKHEVDLHIVNDPMKELRLLEKITGRRPKYYTIHGTSRLLARLMWKRLRSKRPQIPEGFPLESLHKFKTSGLDVLCFTYPPERVFEVASSYIEQGHIIQFHPIWLFQRGTLNHRGAYYQVLKKILDVDRELYTFSFRKKDFFTIASDSSEYAKSVLPSDGLVRKLRERGADIFTFIERKWCCPITSPDKSWRKADDNIALLHVETYQDWLHKIGKKTRNMIRKAEKSRIKTDVVIPDTKLAAGIWRIYNETPIRQGRGFPHYGTSLEAVEKSMTAPPKSSYIAATLQDEIVGFLKIDHGDNIAVVSQILSLQKHMDKAVNNALIAKTVEICASMHVRWIMYGRVGNHPTLDRFKESNGFSKYILTRFYIPLTRKGNIAANLKLHRELKDITPQPIKNSLFPIYNWISRQKTKLSTNPNSQSIATQPQS